MILQWSHSLGLNGSFIRLDAYCRRFISLTYAHSTKCILIYNRTLNQCYFPGFFVVCQVFSVGVLLSIGVTVMIMAMIFLRAAGQQNWSYWVLSTVLALLMSISSKFTP